jgi:hypothetical protein
MGVTSTTNAKARKVGRGRERNESNTPSLPLDPLFPLVLFVFEKG